MADDRKQKTEHKELRNLFMETTSRKDLHLKISI
jgi:hypothetical protein